MLSSYLRFLRVTIETGASGFFKEFSRARARDGGMSYVKQNNRKTRKTLWRREAEVISVSIYSIRYKLCLARD